MSILTFIARRLPLVVKAKRYAVAVRDVMTPARCSYAQHGEDKYVIERLRDLDLHKGIYVDVGANQPTQISNSYLFYRRGLHGVVVEPNQAMESLFMRFRPRDIFLRIGCGASPDMAVFKHSASSVLSSFSGVVGNITRIEHVPVLPLDIALRQVQTTPIFLLSIDTEGFDVQVLEGAKETLARTVYAVVEQSGPSGAIDNKMRQAGFTLETVLGCNSIYVCDSHRQILAHP